MNERIKELAKQADIEVAHTRSDHLRSELEIKHQWVERFAELIVRECAEVARLNTRVDSKVYLMIKEHFGVE